MNKFLFRILSGLLAFLTACVGVDVVTPESTSMPQIRIDTSLDSLKVGEDFQLAATVTNEEGTPINGAQIIWTSLTPEQASINMEGWVTGLSVGQALITAQYEELSDSKAFHIGHNTVATQERSFSFSGRNGYNVDGTGLLSVINDEIILQFNSDFSSDSGPGLYVYLSNNATSVQGGVELLELKANSGGQTYNITQLLFQTGSNVTVGLNTFSYVIIYCKPFGVVFGVGVLQN